MHDSRPTAIAVTSFDGDPTVEERTAAALRDERPRKDFVEVAQRLPAAVVIDAHYMRQHASRRARLVARVAGLPAGQVVELFVRRRRYAHILAWADRIGVPLALLLKLRRAPADIVLVSVLLTRGAKAFLVGRIRVHTHLRAILVRALQRELLLHRLRVPAEKLVADPFGVDEHFFRPPAAPPSGRLVCAVGWEERDYPTLLRAIAGLDADVELAVGSIAMAEGSEELRERTSSVLGELPPNVRLTNRTPAELRDLYAASRCVVVPVREAGFDAGVTATVEAMASGRPVVATRTRGLADLFVDGEHGLYVPPGDVEALRAAVTRLLDDPELAEPMGRAARALVERNHRLDERVERIVATVLTSPRAA